MSVGYVGLCWFLGAFSTFLLATQFLLLFELLPFPKFVRAADLFSRARLIQNRLSRLADGEYDPPRHPTLDFLFLGEGSTWNSSVWRDIKYIKCIKLSYHIMSKIFQPVIFPLFQEELQKIDPMHSQNTCHNTSMLRCRPSPRISGRQWRRHPTPRLSSEHHGRHGRGSGRGAMRWRPRCNGGNNEGITPFLPQFKKCHKHLGKKWLIMGAK